MLIGDTNEERIWEYLARQGFPLEAVAGIVGNIRAESHYSPINLENYYEKKYGWDDEEYTRGVDDGTIDFEKPVCGYGICQWTYYTRKRALKQMADKYGVSIGNLEMQLEYLMYELKERYTPLYKKLMKCKNIQEASDLMLTQFERPADTGAAVKQKRGDYSRDAYERLKNFRPKVGMSVYVGGTYYFIKQMKIDMLYVGKMPKSDRGMWIKLA